MLSSLCHCLLGFSLIVITIVNRRMDVEDEKNSSIINNTTIGAYKNVYGIYLGKRYAMHTSLIDMDFKFVPQNLRHLLISIKAFVAGLTFP